MAHYSEMNFLFDNTSATKILNNTNRGNVANIFNGNKYVIFKSNKNENVNTTNDIKNYYNEKIYKTSNQNPYTKLLSDFNSNTGTPGAGLKIKAADLAYLRDLGVYPINRMVILRRFPEGAFVTEDLTEVKIEPISTIIGWIKPDQNFGSVSFNENWTKTTNRFDVLLTKIIKKNLGMQSSSPIVPIPDFAQGMLYEFYNKMELLDRSGVDDSVDEKFDSHTSSSISSSNNSASQWGLSKIPVGDPNVLQEGPFRDPVGQNIQSDFSFDLETTYEQKILGDVDPGSAMLDILDNIYAMGTSNMTFYWGDSSPTIANARIAAKGNGSNLNAWWDFVSDLMKKFWKVMTDFFKGVYEKVEIEYQKAKKSLEQKANRTAQVKKLETQQSKINNDLSKLDVNSAEYDKKLNEYLDIESEIIELNNSGSGADGDTTFIDEQGLAGVQPLLQSILTSTIAVHRFEIRGSIELMVGGKYSSTPWHLSLGNPYTPWLATNHIIVKSASVESSNEMGFNDQPQRLTAKFNCQFSRALGKQELMRMFNNSFRRTYDTFEGSIESKQANVVNQQNSDPPKHGGLEENKLRQNANNKINEIN